MDQADRADARVPREIAPEQLSDFKHKSPKKKAAGFPAILSTLKQTKDETGVFRGLKILGQVNQQDGFDYYYTGLCSAGL